MSPPQDSHYDVAVIGCGMSGLGCAIRCALFGQKVLLLERHNVPGGLNSFYFKDGRKFDVGLHALTNYVPKGTPAVPLTRICRQLRLDYDRLGLCPQNGSRVSVAGTSLRFTNDFALLETQVAEDFPAEIDGFRRLARMCREYDRYGAVPRSARDVLGEYLSDPLLTELLLCPVLFYGSATESDLDFEQFILLFQAIFLQGFARPFEGIRPILRLLLDHYKALGGERRMKCGVRRIVTGKGRAKALELDDGTTITANRVVSSAGLVETMRLCDEVPNVALPPDEPVAPFSFAEAITVLDRPPSALGWEETIVFFSDTLPTPYRNPRADRLELGAGVLCFPDNYRYPDGQTLPDHFLRTTVMADHAAWTGYGEEAYRAAKEEDYARMGAAALKHLPPLPAGLSLDNLTLATDMFTPRTITRFTGHLGGGVYGATRKVKDGRTHLENLHLTGTDTGLLGVVGAILAGVRTANEAILKNA